MDFINGLSRTQTDHDAIWVIVDRLTKLTHFLAIFYTFSLDRLAKLYINEIIKLYGVLVTIVLDRDLRFISRFQPRLQKALGTTLHFSTTFHLQITDQIKRTIQTLEDMHWACVLEFKGSWVLHLSLVEFAYNNSYHANIGMAPYEALYRRKCQTLLYQDEVGERKLEDVELIESTLKKVKIIREILKAAQDQQKSYADTQKGLWNSKLET